MDDQPYCETPALSTVIASPEATSDVPLMGIFPDALSSVMDGFWGLSSGLIISFMLSYLIHMMHFVRQIIGITSFCS